MSKLIAVWHGERNRQNYQQNEPFVLDVFVDACSDENGDDGVIPACNEHERQTEADAEHWQNPTSVDHPRRHVITHWSTRA